MIKDNRLSRISHNPNICFGKHCIPSYRIFVSLIIDLLAGENSHYNLDGYMGKNSRISTSQHRGN